MIFQQLENFIVVADCGSINKAADKLFISQQALRSSINSLERKLGFKLFIRSAKGMELTAEGKAVYGDSRKIIQIGEQWRQYSSAYSSPSGTVRITASTIVCNSVLTDVVSKCKNQFPNLSIILYEAREDELLSGMSQRMIGVLGSAPLRVIQNKVIPFARRKNLSFETYAVDEFCVYLNSKHSLATRQSLTCDQLNQLVLAIYPDEERKFYYSDIFSMFYPVTPYYMQRQENIYQLISENINVASVFPRIGTVNNHYVDSGQICALPVSDYPMPGISCMLFPGNTVMSPAEEIVSSMIRNRMNEISDQLQLEIAPINNQN